MALLLEEFGGTPSVFLDIAWLTSIGSAAAIRHVNCYMTTHLYPVYTRDNNIHYLPS